MRSKHQIEETVIKAWELRILNFKNKGRGNNLQDRPHRVVFIPKFHCKLNPVECIACYVKTYTRIHCDYIPFVELENITNHDVVLDSVIVDLMRKFLERLEYRKGKIIGNDMKKILKH